MEPISPAFASNRAAESAATLERIASLASAETVYGQPLVGEGFQVLAALEVALVDGLARGRRRTRARPVAVISLTAAGVRVEPIIDRPRVLLSFVVALGLGLLGLARRC